MAARCTVCASADVASINLAISRGAFLSDLARTHGLSEDSLYRHRDRHLAAWMVRTSEAHPAPTAAEQLEAYEVEVGAILTKAKTEPKVALQAIQTGLKLVELRAKFDGTLRSGSTTVNNTLVQITDRDYLRLKAVMLEETMDYPEVQARIMRRLEAENEQPSLL